MRIATRMAAVALLFVTAASTVASQPAAAVSQRPGPGAEGAADATAPLSAAGRYIVILKDGKSVDTATGRAGKLGVKADRTFRHAVHGYAARLAADQLATLRGDPDVEAVVPDEVISIAGQSIPTGVRRVNGRESLIAGIDGDGSAVDADVAIVDTGIGGSDSRRHEDLNIAGGISCATSNPGELGRCQRPRDARGGNRGCPRQRHRRRRGRPRRAAVVGPDPRLGGQRADQLVRLRPGLDHRPAGSQRPDAPPVRGREHVGRQAGHRRPRLRRWSTTT